LLSQVFDEVEDVVSFSEPDVLTSCLFMRDPDGSRDPEIADLIRGCLYLLCKPQGGKTYAIKWRDWIVQIGDLIHAAFPRASNIFLYRDAEKWANSWHRVYSREGIDFDRPTDMSWIGNEDEVSRCLPFFPELTEGFGKARIVDALTTMWLSSMDGCLRLCRQDMPFLAVRYEDLNAHRQPVITAIFDHCGIPATQVKEGLRAFGRDAQEGTPLVGTSQEAGPTQFSMSEDHVARLRAILQKHDSIKTPDFTLPGTLAIPQA
jgi:hypothetical protein